MNWSSGLVAKVVFMALVALGVGAALGYVLTHERGPSRPKSVKPASPAGPAELALIAPLAVGSTVDGYELRTVDAVHDGVEVLTFARGASIVRIEIALDSPEAPATAGRYAVFYSLADGSVPEADGQMLAKTVAAALQREAPTPAGLTVRQRH